MLEIFNYIGISLLLFSAGIEAQSGYNYGRPEISNAASGGVGSSNPLRPIVPVNSNALTASSNTPLGYPTAAGSVFGGTAGTGATPYSNFGTQPSALSSTAPGTYSGATGTSTLQVGTGFNAQKRPIITPQQRGSAGGVFSGGLTNIAGGQSTYNNAARISTFNDIDYSGEGDYSAIPGVPAVDYPIYAQVPQTNFDCGQQLPGYYSDVDAQCQVFHICALNRTYSFLCPNGTIFSQETLVCVWWNQFQCATAPALYGNNAYIYDYGNEQRTSNTYSGTGSSAQLGARQPASYPAASSANSLRPTSTTLPSTGGIFGSANLRPNAYGTVPNTPVTPVPSIAGYNTNTARYPGGPPSAAQSFNTAIAPIAVTQPSYGPGGVGVSATGAIPAETTSTNANSNREYLPPSQQQRRP